MNENLLLMKIIDLIINKYKLILNKKFQSNQNV